LREVKKPRRDGGRKEEKEVKDLGNPEPRGKGVNGS